MAMIFDQGDRCWGTESASARPAASARVLVVGDPAVGKTALVEMICGMAAGTLGGGAAAAESDQRVPQQSDWTCGCSVSIARESLEFEMRAMEVEVEIWEVGGTRSYSWVRSVFYEDLDAALLVYDVSNVKSYHNLVKWLFELCSAGIPPSLRYWDAGGGSGGEPDLDLEGGNARRLRQEILGGRIPVLFVANKCDLRAPGEFHRCLPRPSPEDQPPLLDRLLGGDPHADARPEYDVGLKERLCDFVQQGRHMEASSVTHSFDMTLWKDFVRRTLECKSNRIEK